MSCLYLLAGIYASLVREWNLKSTEKRQPGFFYGYIIVASAHFCSLVAYGTFFTFGVFFEPLLAEFGWTRAATSGAFSLQWLVCGLSSMAAGGLTDRFGPRRVILGSALFLGLGYLLMSRVTGIWQLYLFYGVLIGLGMTGSFVPVASTTARWFIRRRGLMTGIVLSSSGLGTLLWAPLATWLISDYGWRTSYVIIGVMALVCIIPVAQFLRRDPGEVGQQPYGAGMAKIESHTLQTSGFSFGEAIHTWQFWVLFATYVCYGMSGLAVMVHIVPHAIKLGISPSDAANVLGMVGALTVVGRITLGNAGDRIGSRAGLIISFVLMSIAFIWLQVAKELWMLYLFTIVFGFGFGGLGTLQPMTVAELFGLSAHGALVGVVGFGFALGAAVGPVVAGAIFDITGSYQWAFLLCAVVSLIGIILSSLLRPAISRKGVY